MIDATLPSFIKVSQVHVYYVHKTIVSIYVYYKDSTKLSYAVTDGGVG